MWDPERSSWAIFEFSIHMGACIMYVLWSLRYLSAGGFSSNGIQEGRSDGGALLRSSIVARVDTGTAAVHWCTLHGARCAEERRIARAEKKMKKEKRQGVEWLDGFVWIVWITGLNHGMR